MRLERTLASCWIAELHHACHVPCRGRCSGMNQRCAHDRTSRSRGEARVRHVAGQLAIKATVVVFLSSGSTIAAPSQDGRVAARLDTITRQSVWKQVAVIPLRFATFHPQGLLKIGADFYLSSVEVRDAPERSKPVGSGYGPGSGVGHLFKFDADGALRTDLHLGEGTAYHPGGIDYDGRSIWVPVSEYRPDSRAVIYKVDPDHDGGEGGVPLRRPHRRRRPATASDTHAPRLQLGLPPPLSLAAGLRRRRDRRPGGGRPRPPRPTASHYIDYQDCHGLGGGEMRSAAGSPTTRRRERRPLSSWEASRSSTMRSGHAPVAGADPDALGLRAAP